MAQSMTGFAYQSRDSSSGVVVVEVKSVNHRHLECVLRLGDGLEALETAVRQRIGQRLARGRIEVSIRVETDAKQTGITIDDEKLEAVVTALEHIRDRAIDCDLPDALSLMNYPGVQKHTAVDIDQIQSEVLAALDNALDSVIERRRSEGERLVAAMNERLTKLGEQAAAIHEYLPSIEQSMRKRLQRRLDGLDVETDPGRLEQELALAAQRMDIAEELDRIDSHRRSIEEVLASDGAVGRRLDFWLQELMREINTISSKVQDSGVTAHTVDAKVMVEQMREQAQNLE